MGGWLRAHGLPCQGLYVDTGIEAGRPRSEGDGKHSNDAIVPASVAKGPTTRALLLRDGSQEPIDDLEYDYLVHLAHDFELIYEGESQKREERHIAQTLQIGMRNSLGDVPGIATDSVYLSATNSALVGGDFYTLVRLPDDCAVMILGDVSGKGIEAASMSALVKTALTAYAWEGAGPAVWPARSIACSWAFRGRDVRDGVYRKIDLKAGRATYCSAGHPPTMVIRPSSTPLGGGETRGGEVELLGCQSGVIGAFESMVYETGVFTFAPGDMLFMYTDGAIEARDRSGAFFGEQRFVTFCSLSRVRVYRESAVRSWESLTALPSRRWTMTLRWFPLSFYGVDRRPRYLTGKICAAADMYASSELFWGTMVV